MNLGNRLSNKPSMLMMIGMTCLVISSLPTFIHVTTKLNSDAIDFARGVLIGLSMLIGGVVALVARRQILTLRLSRDGSAVRGNLEGSGFGSDQPAAAA